MTGISSDMQKGFSLVELSIVLIIIGLAIGGVLKGQEMIENARTMRIIKNVQSYTAAVATFKSMYGALPGDFSNATVRVPNCTGGNTCVNGNRNDIIGNSTAEMWMSIENYDIYGENLQFWKHLELAGLISGVSASASSIELGQSNPEATPGSAFLIVHTLDNRWSNLPTHYFAIRRDIYGFWNCNGPTSNDCAVTPLRATQIDQKMDDGFATRSSVLAASSFYSSGCGYPNMGTQGANGYSTESKFTACDMFFPLEVLMMNQHATALTWNDKGFLFIGPPGCGKSTLALELMTLGATLIADDQIILTHDMAQWIATCPIPIQNKIHIRDIGIMHVNSISSAAVHVIFQSDRPATLLSQPPALDLPIIPLDFMNIHAVSAIQNTLSCLTQ